MHFSLYCSNQTSCHCIYILIGCICTVDNLYFRCLVITAPYKYILYIYVCVLRSFGPQIITRCRSSCSTTWRILYERSSSHTFIKTRWLLHWHLYIWQTNLSKVHSGHTFTLFVGSQGIKPITVVLQAPRITHITTSCFTAVLCELRSFCLIY